MASTKPLRVVIADDHHHVLPEIHLSRSYLSHTLTLLVTATVSIRMQAIRNRALPFSDIHVLHFDAHPDLSFPRAVDPALVFQPEELYDALDESISGIAEFLLPLIYGGHVSQITWIKPHWAQQPLAHFIEEDSYAPVDTMDPATLRQWGLSVAELPDEQAASNAESSVVLQDAMKPVRESAKAYVLDIDLDYFSTWNPFRKDLEQRVGSSISNTVAQIFCRLRYKNMQNGMSVGQRLADRRAFAAAMEKIQLKELFLDPASAECQQILTTTLLGLYSEGVEGPPSAGQLLSEFFKVLAELDEDTRKLVWWAGPNMDLPHHLSSEGEIERMVSAFKSFLIANGCQSSPPALVTIAKSIGDEYLPPHQVDFVLSRVLRLLEEVFGQLQVEFVEYQSVDVETSVDGGT